MLNPTADSPWVLGQKNILAWRVASGTGIKSFDVQMHNFRHGVMEGAIRIAKNVPMERMSGGYRNYGGEIEVDLDGTIPTGYGFVIAFVESVNGQVYSISPPFSIVDSPPSNYTDIPEGLTAAATTATLHDAPNPTMQWAITLDGPGVVITTPTWYTATASATST